MKTNTFFYTTLIIGIIALYFGGCSVKNQENEIFNSTYDKFHGRYKIIKSTASEPTDMNFDGKKSDDLIKEIIDLQNSILQLNIY